jgi:hypothetical protein
MTLEQDNSAVARQAVRLVSRLLADYNRITLSPEYEAVFTLAHVHGVPYRGPFHNEALYREAQEFVKAQANYLEEEKEEEKTPSG